MLHDSDASVHFVHKLDKVLTEEVYSLHTLRSPQRPRKHPKLGHSRPITFGRMRTSLGKPHLKTIRILCDSGTTGTIVEPWLVKKLRVRDTEHTTWNTKSGNLDTNKKCKVQFSLPEFYTDRVIEWDVHVSNTTDSSSPYDMIMGSDLMETLGLNIDYSDMTVKWEEASIPMRGIDITPEDAFLVATDADSDTIREATRRVE